MSTQRRMLLDEHRRKAVSALADADDPHALASLAHTAILIEDQLAKMNLHLAHISRALDRRAV